MSWLKVDDEMVSHPKIIRVGPLGFTAQMRAMSYCARFLTDGFIPDGLVPQITADLDRTADWEKVMTEVPPGFDKGLWEKVSGGYLVHDYLEYNPTRAEVVQGREQRRQAGANGGMERARRQRAKRTSSDSLDSGLSNSQAKLSPVPVPLPVLPKSKRERHRAPENGAQLSQDFRTFYETYPLHKAPDKAERAFRAALKSGATLEQMLAAIVRQREERETRAASGQFVPEWAYPATWLNQGRWKDEALPGPASKPKFPEL